ncbi:helix-turn-helix transcriptional regulator [Roseovarius autotrophicus]|uniref:helix-turn-helix transcriptional regulator n=1 Tax=Roseovarius autotrophicus TaxID=2824121 RepID=UPI001B39B5CA|nr:helix-turn-helix domain-containing protein [Roseovarius autotrophicus]
MAETRDSDIFEGYLTREELAEKLGVQPQTIAKWSTYGIGPEFVKVGRRVYYHEQTVREWLKTRVVRKG